MNKTTDQQDTHWQSSMSSVRERNAVMLDKAFLADVYFVVGSEPSQCRIPAHKNMLAAGSSVFYAMFCGALAGDEEIAIPDVEPEAFLNLLKWVKQWWYCAVFWKLFCMWEYTIEKLWF